MKIIQKKSLFSLFAIILVVALLSACASNNGGNTTQGAQSNSSQKETAAGNTANDSSEEKPTLKFLINSSFYDVEADAGAEITRQVSGYDIEFEVISDVEQLMLIISSGEPYDYVYLNKDNYNLLMNHNALLDISGLLDEHGENITEAITTLWPGTTVDGKIYGIPSTIAQPNSLVNSIVARGDLLDEAGIEIPETIDEFYEALVALKQAYPDMVPLTSDAGIGLGGYFVANLAGAFGITGQWMDVDGKVTPIIKHPRMEEYLTFMSKLYAEGLYDDEMPALSKGDRESKWTSSKAVMMHSSWNGIETHVGALRELQPGMRVDVMPIMKGADGTQLAEKRSGFGAIGGIPVTSEHPEHAIKAINNIIELENFTKIALGDEGVHHTYEDGKYTLIQPAFNDERVNSNVFIAGFYREDVYPKMWEARLSKNEDLETIFHAFKDSIEGIGVDSPVSLAPPVTVVDNMSALNEYVRDSLNATVAGVHDVDYLDEIIAYWDNNGGLEIEEFYNDWYANK